MGGVLFILSAKGAVFNQAWGNAPGAMCKPRSQR